MIARASWRPAPVRSAVTDVSCHGVVSYPCAWYSTACSRLSSLSASLATFDSGVLPVSYSATRSWNTLAASFGHACRLVHGDAFCGLRGHVGAADCGHIADPGLSRVMQQAHGRRAPHIRAFDRGQDHAHDAHPERVLGDRLREPHQPQPARAGQVLERADLEQVGGRPGERFLIVRRRGQAHLIADEDAASDLAAHEALGTKSVDRRLHCLPRHPEESCELLAGLKPGPGLELAREDRCADAGGDLDVRRPRIRPVYGLHTRNATACLDRQAVLSTRCPDA